METSQTVKKGALQGALSNSTQNHCNRKNKRQGKLESLFKQFAHGDRLHRFHAERVDDHYLHTTVIDLQKRHDIKFSREFVKVPIRFGSETSVKEYWLEGEQLQKARKIVGLERAAA